MSHRSAPRLMPVLAGVLLTLGCDARATLTYEPPYLPIQITVDTKGEVTWQTKDKRRLVTPIGVFQLGVSQTIVPEKSELVLVVRDTRRAAGQQEQAFRVKSNSHLVLLADGRTQVEVHEGRITIDVSRGRAYRLVVNGKPSDFALSTAATTPANPTPPQPPPPVEAHRAPPPAVPETVLVTQPPETVTVAEPTPFIATVWPEDLPFTLAPGVRFGVTVEKEVESGAGASGKKLEGRVMENVRSTTGAIIIPRRSKVTIKVDAFPHPGSDDDPGTITLRITKVQVNGHEYRLAATVEPPTLELSTKRVSSEDASKVVVGAAVGALAGGLIKGRSGVVRGGAIGAGTGAAVSVATVERRARLREGTPLQVVLDQPFAIPRKKQDARD